jgi:hypothetical protein
MKLALHHPFEAVQELLLIDGQHFNNFAEAYVHVPNVYHMDKHHMYIRSFGEVYVPLKKRRLRMMKMIIGRFTTRIRKIYHTSGLGGFGWQESNTYLDALGQRSAD